MRKSIIAVLVTAALSAPAWAQAPGSSTGAGIDAREANQQRRIEQGIKSGTLTPGETKRLEGREMSIQRQEERDARARRRPTHKTGSCCAQPSSR